MNRLISQPQILRFENKLSMLDVCSYDSRMVAPTVPHPASTCVTNYAVVIGHAVFLTGQ